jgi:hypothetical protein
MLHSRYLNPLNAELNPICRLLSLLGARHILHVSRIRVKHDDASRSSFQNVITEVRNYKLGILNITCTTFRLLAWSLSLVRSQC